MDALTDHLRADPDAELLVRGDPFAFLLGALLDHGIPPERAWRGPLELRRRLGHLDPARMAAEPDAVRVAVAGPPALHRYRETVARWLIEAARRVAADHGGDAGAIWGDEPTRSELHQRLLSFPGMGEVKSARTIEMLERDLGVRLRPEGSSAASLRA